MQQSFFINSIHNQSFESFVYIGDSSTHEGVDWSSASTIISLLEKGGPSCPFENRRVETLDCNSFGKLTLKDRAHQVVVMGGGECSKWDRQLSRLALENLRSFVENGGHYVGICAGAYFGCRIVNYNCNSNLVIARERPLPGFFSGTARGPLVPSIDPTSILPWRPEVLNVRLYNQRRYSCVVLGGGYFVPNPELREEIDYKVLARYENVEQERSLAAIRIPVKRGLATLCFPHPEFDVEAARKVINNATTSSVELYEAEEPFDDDLVTPNISNTTKQYNDLCSADDLAADQLDVIVKKPFNTPGSSPKLKHRKSFGEERSPASLSHGTLRGTALADQLEVIVKSPFITPESSPKLKSRKSFGEERSPVSLPRGTLHGDEVADQLEVIVKSPFNTPESSPKLKHRKCVCEEQSLAALSHDASHKTAAIQEEEKLTSVSLPVIFNNFFSRLFPGDSLVRADSYMAGSMGIKEKNVSCSTNKPEPSPKQTPESSPSASRIKFGITLSNTQISNFCCSSRFTPAQSPSNLQHRWTNARANYGEQSGTMPAASPMWQLRERDTLHTLTLAAQRLEQLKKAKSSNCQAVLLSEANSTGNGECSSMFDNTLHLHSWNHPVTTTSISESGKQLTPALSVASFMSKEEWSASISSLSTQNSPNRASRALDVSKKALDDDKNEENDDLSMKGRGVSVVRSPLHPNETYEFFWSLFIR